MDFQEVLDRLRHNVAELARIRRHDPHPGRDHLFGVETAVVVAEQSVDGALVVGALGSGYMLQRMVDRRGACAKLRKLPSSRRISPMFLVGTDDDRTRVTLALDQAAAAVR